MSQHVDREALIGAHLDFARRLARERQGRGVSPQDLEQEAMVGLCEGAAHYEPSKGDFAQYIAHWIRKYLNAALDAAVVVKVPVRLERAIRKAHRARAALVAAGDRSPTTRAVAVAAGLDVELCGEALRRAPSETPVDRFGILDPMDGKGDGLADELWDVVNLCDQLERAAVLIDHFGLAGDRLSLAAIGRKLGIDRRRVGELLAQGLDVVRREFLARGWTPRSWALAVSA